MYDEILELDKQLCFRLYQVSRNMTRLYQPFLDKFHLTYPQYIVMLVLFERESIDFKELSKLVDLKTGTLTPIIQKLQETGYLVKIKNPIDGRKINVEITKKGRDLRKAIIEVPLGIAQKLPITEEMYQVLVKELDQLSTLLKNASIVKRND